MKVALCCIIKNENLYLKEWVEYYKNLGFNHIFIYDHNDKNGEDPREVINEYINEKYVTIIDFREKQYCQIEAYKHCYDNYNDEYDWFAFFDADEFLWIKNSQSINDFLNNNKFNNAKLIYINWVCYGDNEHLYYENKPVIERFSECSNTIQAHISMGLRKAIVKSGIKNIAWDIRRPHSTVDSPDFLYGCNGDLVIKCYDAMGNITRPWPECISSVAECIAECHLKHFITKSTEEYILRKMLGYPDYPSKFNFKNVVDTYFKYNTFNFDKLEIMINTYNIYKEKYKL